MRMNVFEMEGFLRGKCVPRDLKVNETNAEYLVRKFDALEAKCAALENKIIPVSAELPPANESVLLFDANGEGWLIGWRSLWYTWGQKETGEWLWTFQVGDLENVNITHWAVMPKAPKNKNERDKNSYRNCYHPRRSAGKKLHQTKRMWVVGKNEFYHKETGRRHFAENTRRRLLIDTIKPIEVKHV